jgi:hypothetical protein
MRYLALACDYDGTLATDGRVPAITLEAIPRLRASGRKLVLVTGRELDDLIAVFPHVDICEWVVAENGAVLYRPATREEKCLAEPPPPVFIQELRKRRVAPLSIGRVIVATWQPHETTVLEAIRDLGLERQVIFNKGAVMVLPSGVNKATGLRAALAELELSAHNVVGVGDAENDHAFLEVCECAVAVANALPMVKDHADLVTQADHGAGVMELIDGLVERDLRDVDARLSRHHILLGTRENGEPVRIPPYGLNLLLAGSSGSGKSSLATGLLERLAQHGYQVCVIDPEGDYEGFKSAVVLGDRQRPPSVDEVLQVLKKPDAMIVVNLVGLSLEERPTFFSALLPRLQELRARTGRPHWLVVDETHHVLPAARHVATLTLPHELKQVIFISVHPSQITPAALASVDTVITVGETAYAALQEATQLMGLTASSSAREPVSLQPGEALMWGRSMTAPIRVHIEPTQTESRRHRRKYAEGELGPDRSFYFQGPEGRLNLRAQNLLFFIQLADGVDDETWLYHLRRGDYSRWFREQIKDDVLALEAEKIEGRDDLSPAASRAQLKEVITDHYTLPAAVPEAGAAAKGV